MFSVQWGRMSHIKDLVIYRFLGCAWAFDILNKLVDKYENFAKVNFAIFLTALLYASALLLFNPVTNILAGVLLLLWSFVVSEVLIRWSGRMAITNGTSGLYGLYCLSVVCRYVVIGFTLLWLCLYIDVAPVLTGMVAMLGVAYLMSIAGLPSEEDKQRIKKHEKEREESVRNVENMVLELIKNYPELNQKNFGLNVRPKTLFLAWQAIEMCACSESRGNIESFSISEDNSLLLDNRPSIYTYKTLLEEIEIVAKVSSNVSPKLFDWVKRALSLHPGLRKLSADGSESWKI